MGSALPTHLLSSVQLQGRRLRPGEDAPQLLPGRRVVAIKQEASDEAVTGL